MELEDQTTSELCRSWEYAAANSEEESSISGHIVERFLTMERNDSDQFDRRLIAANDYVWGVLMRYTERGKQVPPELAELLELLTDVTTFVRPRRH